MPIKVNVTILNHRPGDIIREDSGDYDRFLSWAKREDKHQGKLICEVISEEDVSGKYVSPFDKKDLQKDPLQETKVPDPLKCDKCDFVASSENGLKIHKARSHKEE